MGFSVWIKPIFCFQYSHPRMVFPSDQGHRTPKKEREHKKIPQQWCSCRMSMLPTDLTTKIFLPHPFFLMSCFLHWTSSGTFPRPFVLFAKSRMDGARINSHFWENIEAILYKVSLYYLQILVGSHEAWGVSLVPGKQTQQPQPACPAPASRQQEWEHKRPEPLTEDAAHVIL